MIVCLIDLTWSCHDISQRKQRQTVYYFRDFVAWLSHHHQGGMLAAPISRTTRCWMEPSALCPSDCLCRMQAQDCREMKESRKILLYQSLEALNDEGDPPCPHKGIIRDDVPHAHMAEPDAPVIQASAHAVRGSAQG